MSDLTGFLTRYNYHLCDENVASGDVMSKTDFEALPESHRAYKAAVRALQTVYRSHLDRMALSANGYGRRSIADGEAGPFTESVVLLPRCGLPDFPSLAELDRGTMEASIPPSCRHEITASRNFANVPGMTREETQAAFDLSAANWNNALDCKIVELGMAQFDSAVIYAILAALSRGVLADQVLAYNQCNSRQPGRYTSRIEWYFDYLCAVASHERGHALGLRHVPDGRALMNPSITDEAVRDRGKPQEADIKEAEIQSYKRRTSLPPEPTPVPGDWVKGIMSVQTPAGRKLGEIQVLPRTAEIEHTDGRVIVRDTFTIMVGGQTHKFICAPDSKNPDEV